MSQLQEFADGKRENSQPLLSSPSKLRLISSKTTRCFQQNDTSLSTKQHVTFNKTTRHFQQRSFAAQCTPLDGAHQTLSYKTQKNKLFPLHTRAYARIYAHIKQEFYHFCCHICHTFSLKTFKFNRLPLYFKIYFIFFSTDLGLSPSKRVRRLGLGVTLVTAKKLNCCWKACAPARTHVCTRKLERMHATSTAFELYLSDLSPFALCAPSFLRRLWVGKVFRIANHLNLLTTISNFKTYKIFFVTFLRFFPSLGQYLPIYFIGRRETNIQRSSYFIPLPRRMPILHISHQPLQTFVTIQSFNKIVPDKNSAFCKKIASFLTFFYKLLFSNRQKVLKFASNSYFINSAWQNEPT